MKTLQIGQQFNYNGTLLIVCRNYNEDDKMPVVLKRTKDVSLITLSIFVYMILQPHDWNFTTKAIAEGLRLKEKDVLDPVDELKNNNHT